MRTVGRSIKAREKRMAYFIVLFLVLPKLMCLMPFYEFNLARILRRDSAPPLCAMKQEAFLRNGALM